MKTTQYLVFISHKKDGHTNTINKSIHDVLGKVQGAMEFDKVDTSLLSKIETLVEALNDGDDIWTELNGDTWITITRCDIEEPIDASLPLPLKERIRVLSEAEAIGHMVCDDELINYYNFMLAENVFKIATIVELFEHHPTENVIDTVNVLETFAVSIIKEMTVSDLLDVIASRAVEAGAVDSKSQLSLLALKSIGGGARDSFGHNFEDTDECFGNIDDFDVKECGIDNSVITDYLEKASSFGISYVNGY